MELQIYFGNETQKNFKILPSVLKAPVVPSIIFPHHPEGQATTWMPASTSGSVTLNGKGSPQDPNSPLDLHLTHRLCKPKIFFFITKVNNF